MTTLPQLSKSLRRIADLIDDVLGVTRTVPQQQRVLLEVGAIRKAAKQFKREWRKKRPSAKGFKYHGRHWKQIKARRIRAARKAAKAKWAKLRAVS